MEYVGINLMSLLPKPGKAEKRTVAKTAMVYRMWGGAPRAGVACIVATHRSHTATYQSPALDEGPVAIPHPAPLVRPSAPFGGCVVLPQPPTAARRGGGDGILNHRRRRRIRIVGRVTRLIVGLVVVIHACVRLWVRRVCCSRVPTCRAPAKASLPLPSNSLLEKSRIFKSQNQLTRC